MREAAPPESRQAFSAVDSGENYLAMSENNYLTVFRIDPIEASEQHL